MSTTNRLRALVQRLPVRLRLVAGFAAAMIVVLSASGAFVYWRVDYALDRRLDTDLAAQAAAVRPLLDSAGTLAANASAPATDPTFSDFQVLGPTNKVVASGAGLGATSLLSATTLERAQRSAVTVDVGSLLPISSRPLRLLAQPLSRGSGYVLVIGVHRDERDEALRELIAQLGIAALGTLVITTAVGERLAKAALAPVERYRAQAGSIAGGATGVRLDVPTGRNDEVTRLGHTLNEMLDALERSLARERRFLDDASHELRTPLTLLQTRVQLALRRPRSTTEHEAVLAELQTDIVQLAELAETLLVIGAATAQGNVAEVGDVTGVARSLVEAGSTSGLPQGWLLEAPATGTTAVPLSDARLRQVLLNLLTNAHLHGAPPVRVMIRAETIPGGDVVVLTVSDEGAGIPAAFLPKAVERFGRSDEARARPGAGLGLPLVHALVASGGVGGELRLCSVGTHHRYDHRYDFVCGHPDSGTTVTVALPALKTSTAAGTTRDS